MSGSVFLIGGGWDAPEVYQPFLRRAAARGGGVPRVGCVIVDEGDGAAQFERYAAVLGKAGPCAPVPLLVPVGGRFEPEGVLDGVDGLLVCGGLTPAYQEAFVECLDRLPQLLAERGVPYAGFSAGAAVAARRAVVGGWLTDGVPVCPEDTAEDLEEVAVRAGLGLVPFAVDVHAAQWGTLGRLVAVVRRGDVPYGVAVDENTVVEVDGEGCRVAGVGRVHVVRPGGEGGVVVRAYGAGEVFGLS
ncbi:Type 1 glutamine amidotransferase-like domain-containing protein [Streptomyces sp. Ag109_G2-15]|uniref:Type 1 glutamine amidotransferase-like domain-containing protein n=1 Tax=Streptomyces sp. Ag109_G2-15 TaxID=1938850 RepID=UPI000BDC5910|nr:Type 1 glutamine amidotransferase-like domain-containing protein [Streptomyces sp. Ag109_G2-15]SOD84172.1 cyanophycinase [Streptomyces sp. Ag109_G2-15]